MSNNPRILNTINQGTPQFKFSPLGGLAYVSSANDTRKMFSGAVEAYASYTFNIGNNRLTSPTHPVTWYNVRTKQPTVTVNMLSDTGADYSTLHSKYARELGIELTKGQKVTVTGTGGAVQNAYYIHSIPFRIGTLKPVMGQVAVGSGGGTDVLGRTAGLNLFNIEYNRKIIKYSELGTMGANLGQARWRSRI